MFASRPISRSPEANGRRRHLPGDPPSPPKRFWVATLCAFAADQSTKIAVDLFGVTDDISQTWLSIGNTRNHDGRLAFLGITDWGAVLASAGLSFLFLIVIADLRSLSALAWKGIWIGSVCGNLSDKIFRLREDGQMTFLMEGGVSDWLAIDNAFYTNLADAGIAVSTLVLSTKLLKQIYSQNRRSAEHTRPLIFSSPHGITSSFPHISREPGPVLRGRSYQRLAAFPDNRGVWATGKRQVGSVPNSGVPVGRPRRLQRVRSEHVDGRDISRLRNADGRRPLGESVG